MKLCAKIVEINNITIKTLVNISNLTKENVIAAMTECSDHEIWNPNQCDILLDTYCTCKIVQLI